LDFFTKKERQLNTATSTLIRRGGFRQDEEDERNTVSRLILKKTSTNQSIIAIPIPSGLSDNMFYEGYLDRNIQRQATTFSLGFVIVLYYRFFCIQQNSERLFFAL